MLKNIMFVYLSALMVFQLQKPAYVECGLSVMSDSKLQDALSHDKLFLKYVNALDTSLAKGNDKELKKAAIFLLSEMAKKIDQMKIMQQKQPVDFWKLRAGR